jgi:uncharacterized protein DUF3883
MFRLNVGAGQLRECVSRGMFALSRKPQISAGEVLLLQLTKSDWQMEKSNEGRIRHALIFQHAERDEEGLISKTHWPNAGKTWPWILYSSAVLNSKPFSLEALSLSRQSHYQSQANPVRIDPTDEAVIQPYLEWSTMVPLVGGARRFNEEAPMASDDTAVVEEFSVKNAVREVRTWLPNAQVEIKAHNNPGFDLVVTECGQVVRYIEVKGTRVAEPIFHLTETERRFSAENAALYTLLVIWAIDLTRGTYRITRHDGEVAVGPILRPVRYSGRLTTVADMSDNPKALRIS